MTQDTGGVQHGFDPGWERVVRHGTFVALAVGTVMAGLTAGLVPLGERFELIVPLVVAVAVLHWVCIERRWGVPLDDRIGATYLGVRTAIAFALTWLNPFFAFFAAVGYFDAEAFVRRRWIWVPYLAIAVTVAGAQAGGLPPRSPLQAAGFAGLVVVNAVIVMMVARLSWKETDRTEQQTGTIATLERTNARLEQALRENARLQAELVTQAREAGVHDERERLALEIHDTIAQGLTGIVTQLQAADDAPDDTSAHEHRKRAADLARVALGEARRSVQGLGPSSLEHAGPGRAGLERAMQQVVSDWSTSAGVRAELVVTGEPEPLHGDVAAAVVRVAQEALANVARHARATRVGVTVSYLDDEVLLDVRDDGSGFDPQVARPGGTTGGFGLPGMRTRAARVAGELVVESEPGRGTAVSLRVPAVAHD